jgi:hypothetical protein
MWPFPKRTDPEEDPALREAEDTVLLLEHRAHRVERHLRARFDRNHWSETVNELWQGRNPA